MRRLSLFAAASAAMLAAFAPASSAQARPDYRGPSQPTPDGPVRPDVVDRQGGGKGSTGSVELAVADDRQPGSLLLYPEFDNTDGIATFLTITNVDADTGTDVKVEFVYLNEEDCSEFNRNEILTPNDTLTLITSFHNPQHERGYVYAFAKTNGSGPIVWNSLIGTVLIIDGVEIFDYSMNAVSFLGVGDPGGEVQAWGTPTDLDGDGNRDLDGTEYSQAPAKLLVPRFFGQTDDEDPEGEEGEIESELILIALSGGSHFSTRVDFLIYNDNEEVFSSEYEFDCWAKPELLDISGIFDNNFLANYTNDDPDEVFGLNGLESGWFRVDGAVASSTVESIPDPAVYCVLVELVEDYGGADLPFSIGGQDNGSLLPRHILGDGDPTPVDGDGQ